ncbi:MAG: YeiH family protein [Bacteroidales bacterium]
MLKKNSLLHKSLYVLSFALCVTPFVTPPVALLGGFLFTLILGHPLPKLAHKGSKLLLKASVVGLGFGMNMNAAIQSSREGFWLTVATIITVLILGFLLGQWFKMPRKLSHLISSGTAICGGSAIAAVAPSVEADEEEISMSLGVVFLLNSLALIIFPLFGGWLDLSQQQFGLWSAIAIHDTSSVVGAAQAFGNEALEFATTVKLARALWIIPLSVFSMWVFKSKNSKIQIPWFIFLFIGAMIINSYVPSLRAVNQILTDAAKLSLVGTLFLIGSSLSISSIRKLGIKPLLLGVTLWIVISICSLCAILMM